MESDGDETVVDDRSPSGMDEAQKRARKQAAVRKAAERELRRKEQLRANLQRRKMQVRARREGSEDDRPGDLDIGPAEA